MTATAQCIAASQQAEHGLGQVQSSLSARDFDLFQKVSHSLRELAYIFNEGALGIIRWGILLHNYHLPIQIGRLAVLNHPGPAERAKSSAGGCQRNPGVRHPLACDSARMHRVSVQGPNSLERGVREMLRPGTYRICSRERRFENKAKWNQLAFWSVNAAVDVASTLMIGLMPIYLLFNLQLPQENKRLAMLSFTPNLT